MVYRNLTEDVKMSKNELNKIDLIIDLNFDTNLFHLEYYIQLNKPVLVSSVKKQLAEVLFEYEGRVKCTLIWHKMPYRLLLIEILRK